jgi:transmembrane 9 superfamily protein 2/4
VKLYVTKLTSTKTQVPYDYYSLPFCQPKKMGLQHENIGEAMSGDRIENSVYGVRMKETKSCAAACAKKLSQHDSAAFKKAIAGEYRAHWIIDGLPVGSYETFPDGQKVFSRGFPIGFVRPDPKKPKTGLKYYLNNHFRIILQYRDNTAMESEMELSRDFASPVSPAKIVGFHVKPMSVKHTYNDQDFKAGKTILTTCNRDIQPNGDDENFQTVNRGDTVVFTYDVLWEETDVEWTQRWDVYVSASSSPDDKVHWFAITNSILVVVFLSVMIAMILLRALRKDIAKYNDPEAIEEAKEESGWKLVHGDVFRPPANNPMLLRLVTIAYF